MHTAFSSPSSAPAIPPVPFTNTVNERFLCLPEVLHLCGLSRSSVYDLISRNAFSQQVSLGGKNVAWLHSEITAWMVQPVEKAMLVKKKLYESGCLA